VELQKVSFGRLVPKLFYPFVIKSFFSSHPCCDVDVETLTHKVFSLVGNALPALSQLINTLRHRSEDLFVCIACERRLA